jgi:DNA-binding MarR family transcriptional regulator
MQRELERGSNELMKPLGLTGPQADALVVIEHAQPIALKELGRLLIAEAGHPSRLVDRLVDAGLVERRSAADDRRRIELTLTPAGRRKAREVSRARQALFRAGSGAVSRKELDGVLRVFRRLMRDTALADLIARRREFDK